MNGYNGKVLRVDLSSKIISVETPDAVFYRRYAGGRNFGAYYLLKETPPGIDAYDPRNTLVFSVSMLVGSTLSGSSRSSAVAKSPLTNGWGEAEAGGFWPAEFKFAGFDILVITGKSEQPCYLWIHDGQAEIRPALHVWGKEPVEVEQTLRDEVGDAKARICQIGIGGENLVRYANIINDLSHFYGRTGLGAVMGSKNLKAVVVRGTKKIEFADPVKMRALTLQFNQKIDQHPGLSGQKALGTSRAVMPLNSMGLLPTRNFSQGVFPPAEDISGETMHDVLNVKHGTCYSCGVRCKPRASYTSEDMHIDPSAGGPEFETIGTFGSNCNISDIRIIGKANELCGRYGLDTISCGLTIACAMECFENGLISQADTGGLDLRFGNGEAVLACIQMIAKRDGFGNLLAEGSKRFAERLGGRAVDFAMHVRGQELPAHEPRGKWGVALGYALSPTGADHLNAAHDSAFEREADPAVSAISLHDIKPLGILEPAQVLSLDAKKVRNFVLLQNAWSMVNVIDFCLFCMAPEVSMYSLEDMTHAVSAATGWNISLAEMMAWGERGVNLSRIYNIREGSGAAQDTLPNRLFEPLKEGPFDGVAIPKNEFENAVKLYYAMRGWDAQGRPRTVQLQMLDIAWAAESYDGNSS